MKNKILSGVVVAVALFGGIAVAQVISTQLTQQLETSTTRNVSFFPGGLLAGRLSDNNTNATINANRITRTLGGSIVNDFVSSTIVCTDSASITVRGARFGDACSVGISAAPAANSTFSCFVQAADQVRVRHCPAGTAVDPASATYTVRVISAQ